ncbi:MAG TPA: hypothetical protein VK890_05330 [Bacteroidia bacterium]|jgi:hypothetical protein|nr:hypothetical protein [Bacteroidia bacterium]
MENPVFQKLVDQQIAVLRIISYIIVGFISLLFVMVYTAFGIKQTLPIIMLPYDAAVLINILLLFVHKKAYLTYIILISFTFAELMALILVSGGIYSPIVLILITLSWFAFYTSRKQGKLWFVICFVSIIAIYNAAYFNIPVSNIVPEKYRTLFLFIIILFVLFLTSVYLLMVKQDVSNAHKSFSHAKKDIEEKNKRMENLVMLVNYSVELMCVIDINNMVFDEVNPEFKISLGYELSQLRGESVKKLLKDSIIPILAAVKEGEKISFDTPILCRSGPEKMVSWLAIAQNGKLYTYGRSTGK